MLTIVIHFRTPHKYIKYKKTKKVGEIKKNIHQYEEYEKYPENFQRLVEEDQNTQSSKLDNIFSTDEGPIGKENSI
jgi:hypothetical protein